MHFLFVLVVNMTLSDLFQTADFLCSVVPCLPGCIHDPLIPLSRTNREALTSYALLNLEKN